MSVNNKGFTLIELLLVVAAILILTGLIVAKIIPCKSDCGIKKVETKEGHEKIYCERMAKVKSFKDLPVVCTKYYQQP